MVYLKYCSRTQKVALRFTTDLVSDHIRESSIGLSVLDRRFLPVFIGIGRSLRLFKTPTFASWPRVWPRSFQTSS
jgi:hypothetical protein